MGRPTKYTAEIAEKICSLIATDTYTVVEICRMVKIGERTYYEWIEKYPHFSQAIKKAEAKRMAFFVVEAKKSLLKKIQGYTVKEKHTITVGSGKYDANGNEIPRIKEQKTVDKHFQPDTAAIIFTLTNGEPENWKNRQNNEITGKDGKDLFGQLSDDDLNKKIADLENKLKKCRARSK